MSAFLEPRTIHGFDLSLLHPDGVSIVADWSTEVIVFVDQVRPIDASRYLNDNGPLAFLAETVDKQTKYRR